MASSLCTPPRPFPFSVSPKRHLTSYTPYRAGATPKIDVPGAFSSRPSMASPNTRHCRFAVSLTLPSVDDVPVAVRFLSIPPGTAARRLIYLTWRYKTGAGMSIYHLPSTLYRDGQRWSRSGSPVGASPGRRRFSIVHSMGDGTLTVAAPCWSTLCSWKPVLGWVALPKLCGGLTSLFPGVTP